MGWPLKKEIKLKPLNIIELAGQNAGKDLVEALGIMEPILRNFVEIWLNFYIRRVMAFVIQIGTLKELIDRPLGESWDTFAEHKQKYYDRIGSLEDDHKKMFRLLSIAEHRTKNITTVEEFNYCFDDDDCRTLWFVNMGWLCLRDQFLELVSLEHSLSEQFDQENNKLSNNTQVGQFWRLYWPDQNIREKGVEQLRRGFLSKPIHFKRWIALKPLFIQEAISRAHMHRKNVKDLIEDIKISNILISTEELKDFSIKALLDKPSIIKLAVGRLMTEDLLGPSWWRWDMEQSYMEEGGDNENQIGPETKLAADAMKVVFDKWRTKEINESNLSERFEKKCEEYGLDLDQLSGKEKEALRYKIDGIVPRGVKPSTLRKRWERLKISKGIQQ
jgi:hypothetical protein